MNSDHLSSPEVKAAAAELMSTGRPVKETGPNPRVGSYLLSWLAVIAGIAVLIACGYMFYLFAENDLGVKLLASTFILCFGGGALAYGPLFIMAKLIRNGRKTPTKRQAIWVLALAFPWLLAGGVLMTYPNIMRYLGVCTVLLSGILCVWAIRHFASIKA